MLAAIGAFGAVAITVGILSAGALARVTEGAVHRLVRWPLENGSAEQLVELEAIERELEREKERWLCVICQYAEKCVMLLPCNHLCLCSGCKGRISDLSGCPICRATIKKAFTIFL